MTARREPTAWLQTSLGHVPVWGHWSGDGPVVFAIRGAFPPFDQLCEIGMPGADLALVHLPGFFSPVLQTTSPSAFAQAYDEVIRALFAGRPVVAAGLSTGALAALALQAEQVRAVVAIEPFFGTAKLWPLRQTVDDLLARHADQPGVARWIEAVFGFSDGRTEDRRYEDLLEVGSAPILAVVGDAPLDPPRRLARPPSLTDEDDRRLLARYGARITVASGGHDLAVEAPEAVREALRLALADAVANGPRRRRGAPA